MNGSIEDLVERLDILIALAIPKYSADNYPQGAEVVRYCDANHSVPEIVEKSGKTKKAVERALQELRKSGTIRSVKKGGKTFYVRII